MPSGSNIRAGGAYVEAYVKSDKLDPQLTAVNQKVRANVSLARAAIGSVGQGTVGAGGLALASIALVARAGLGFARGFSSPTKQAASGTGEIVRAINSLKPALNQMKSPLDAVFTGIEKGGIRGAIAVRRIRKVFEAIIPVDAINGSIKQLTDGTNGLVTVLNTQLKNIPVSITAAMRPALAEIKAGFASLPALASQAMAALEHKTLVRQHTRKDGTVVPAHSRARPKRKPKEDSRSAGISVANSAATASASLAPLSARLARTDADAHKAAAAMDAFGGVLKRGASASLLAAGRLAGATFLESFKGGVTKSTQLDSALQAGPGKAVMVWARQKLPTAVKLVAGAAIGAALISGAVPVGSVLAAGAGTSIAGSLIGAATTALSAGGSMLATALTSKLVLAAGAGAAMVTKPKQSILMLAGLTTRVFSGVAGGLRGLAGSGASKGLDAVGYSAMRAKGPLGQVSHVASGATRTLSGLAKAGTKVAAGWVKVGAISAGIVGALSMAAGFNTGSLRAAFTSFQDLNPQQISKTSQALGLTVEQTSRLAAAAELGGSSLDSIKGGMQHVNEMVKDGSDKFAKYGLSLEGMKNASPERRLELIAKALSGISDPAKRAAAGVELLGTSDLNGVMANFDGLRSKATLLGGVLSGADVAAGMEFKGALSEMHLASKSLGATLSAAVMPQLTKMVRTTTTMVTGVMQWAQNNRALIGTVFTIAKQVGLVVGVVSAGAAIFGKFAFLGPILGAALAALASPLGIAAMLIGAIALSSEDTRASAVEAFSAIAEGAMGFVDPLIDGFNVIKQDFGDVFGGIVDALGGGNLLLAAEIAGNGLQLIFARAWTFIRGTFVDFKNWFMQGWDNMIAEIRIAGDDLWPGFEQGFSDVIAFLQDGWTVMVNGFLRTFDNVFGTISKWINYLRGLFSKAFDVEGANKAIDKQFEAKAEKRGKEQDDLIAKRDQARRKHTDNLKTLGTRGALDKENAEAVTSRQEEADQAKASDLASINAAKEKLKISLERAKAERKERENSVKTAGLSGAETAKAGAKEASNKGFEANDIRGKEGLSAIAGTARGQKNPLDKQIDLQGKTLAELKKQTDYQQKIWKQQEQGIVPAFPT